MLTGDEVRPSETQARQPERGRVQRRTFLTGAGALTAGTALTAATFQRVGAAGPERPEWHFSTFFLDRSIDVPKRARTALEHLQRAYDSSLQADFTRGHSLATGDALLALIVHIGPVGNQTRAMVAVASSDFDLMARAWRDADSLVHWGYITLPPVSK